MLNLDFFNKQKTFFLSGKTRSVQKRIQVLEKLDSSITSNESKIFVALKKDLNKSNFESYLTEIAILKSEIKLIKRKLKKWSKPKRVKSTLASFPSKDYLFLEPYGITLIISPWNYPFQLALLPLISSIAAGNTVVLKPSEQTPLTTFFISELLAEVFPEGVVNIVYGIGETVGSSLINHQDVNMISLTGDIATGSKVLEAASNSIKKTHLELGGKAPVIVYDDADIDQLIEGIRAFGYYNAGQDCTAACRIFADKKFMTMLLLTCLLQYPQLVWQMMKMKKTKYHLLSLKSI